MNNKALSEQTQAAFSEFMLARDKAIESIKEIVKNAGGLIVTMPVSNKPRLVACIDNGYGCQDDSAEYEDIYALRYNWEDNQLYLCTRTMLDNYEYDNDYNFEYTYDMVGKDADEAGKMINDLAYYIPIDEDYIVRSQTAISILGGLSSYLEDND